MNNFVREELIKYYRNEVTFKDYCQDIASEMIASLLEYSERSDFWESTRIENEENNKRILGYIYQVLHSSEIFLKENIKSRLQISLHDKVNMSLKELVQEEIISFKSIFFKTYYHKKGNNAKKYYYKQIDHYNIDFANIWRGSKKEQIDHEAVKRSIIIIFNSLENLLFSASDIVNIIIEYSNIGLPINGSMNNDLKYKINNEMDMDENDDDVFVDMEPLHDKNEIFFIHQSDKFIKSLKNLYPKNKKGNKMFEEDLKILYWDSMNNLTQQQIALRVFNNKKQFRTVSVRLINVIKKLEVLKRKQIIEINPMEMKAILELIKKRFLTKDGKLRS